VSKFGYYAGQTVYSGYTPTNEISKFNNDAISAMNFIYENEFVTSVTIKHDGNDIEISLLNNEFHIDNVTGKYE
jgi:hypothetical protein